MTISDKINIEWKIVCWLLAAATSYGMMYQKVNNIAEKQDAQGRDLAEIKTYLMHNNVIAQQ